MRVNLLFGSIEVKNGLEGCQFHSIVKVGGYIATLHNECLLVGKLAQERIKNGSFVNNGTLLGKFVVSIARFPRSFSSRLPSNYHSFDCIRILGLFEGLIRDAPMFEPFGNIFPSIEPFVFLHAERVSFRSIHAALLRSTLQCEVIFELHRRLFFRYLYHFKGLDSFSGSPL